jgi:hypothetical protein
MISDMKYHPLAELFPLVEGEEFEALVDDIREHGLHQPIVVYDNQILDGRNRYRACELAGAECRLETYDGDDPAAYVISLNLKRRHLNESQRAMVAVKLATMRQGERTDLKPSAKLQKVAQSNAAALFNISIRTVASAARVRNSGSPQLIGAVEQGRIAVSAAAKIAKDDSETQRMVVEKVRDGSEREAIRAIVAVKRQRREDERRAAFQVAFQKQITNGGATQDAPVAMLGNRPLRIDFSPELCRWTLEIGPNVDPKTHEQRKDKAAQDEIIAGWQRKRKDLVDRAAELEIQAKKLETQSRQFSKQATVLDEQMQKRMRELLEQEYGPAHLGSEILEFEADAAANAELAALPKAQLAERLIAAHTAQGDNSSTHTCRVTPLETRNPLTRVGHSYHWAGGTLHVGDFRKLTRDN